MLVFVALNLSLLLWTLQYGVVSKFTNVRVQKVYIHAPTQEMRWSWCD